MKCAVAIVLAVIALVGANPAPAPGGLEYGHGGLGYGKSVVVVPGAVSAQSQIINHGPKVVEVVRPVIVEPIVAKGLNGLGWNGLGLNGLGWNGLGLNGLGWNGLGHSGLGWNGLGWNGLGWNGLGHNGLGWNGLGHGKGWH